VTPPVPLAEEFLAIVDRSVFAAADVPICLVWTLGDTVVLARDHVRFGAADPVRINRFSGAPVRGSCPVVSGTHEGMWYRDHQLRALQSLLIPSVGWLAGVRARGEAC